VVLGNTASTILVDPSQTYTNSGVISGTGRLNKTGTGTLTLTGTNTFTGATVVDQGTLLASGTSGAALGTTSGITVNAGGTLQLGASNQINNTAGITLDGGTFAKGNFSEGAAGTTGIGALTLSSADSHLDFGTGTVGILTFASFDPSVDLLTLTIDNWTGTPGTVGNGSTDRLIFATDQNANLSSFSFTGYNGAMEIALAGGYYEIIPVSAVPEPSTYFAAAFALAAVLFQQRKRLRQFAPRASRRLPR
jgi:autotransporter-associated beta strand protein